MARPTARLPSLPSGSERVPWVDTAKGICIILVVMMHSTLGVGNEMGGEGWMHAVVAFAKPFRMPDFFLVSGLFLSRVIDRDWTRYADRRVVHFLYFYLLWLVVQSAFKYGQVSGGTPAGFLHHLAVGLYQPYSTLWFVYILAVFSIVTKLLRRIPPTMLLAGAAALQILPIETGSFLLNEFCERWVYFLAGYLGAPHVFRLAGWAVEHRGRALAALAGWAVANGAGAMASTGLPFAPTVAELPVFGLVFGLAGAVAIVTGASLLAGTAIGRPLEAAGARSIAIYLAFFLPMAVTRTLLIRSGLITDIGTVAFLVTAAGVLVPLAADRLVRATPLAFLFTRPAWAHLSRRRAAPLPAPSAG